MALSVLASRSAVLLSCASALLLVGFVSCEEEPVAPQRTIKRRVRATQPVKSSNGLEKYNTLGNGLQIAPDWIKSLDPNMMRRSNQALEGFRYGHAFNPTVMIERGEMGWRLVLIEEPLSSAAQTQISGQRVTLPFKGTPTSLYKQEGNFEQSEVEWSVPKSLTPNDLTPWKVKSAYLLELIDWRVSPYSTKGAPFQEAGRASGRIMLRAKDDKDGEGWVVGRFDNALVRYLGDPALWENAHP